MATSIDFIQFVCEQIRGYTNVIYKKMFGEYMVYVNDKPILLVCDNTVYVKKRDELADTMKDSDRGVPYDGAKEHYILDVENAELTDKVIEIAERITPLPKKKSKKSQ